MGRSLGAGGAGGALQATAQIKKGRKSVRRTHGGIIRFFIELGRRKIRGELKEEKGGVEAWRAQEPINCQAHLQAQLLGASETIPITNGDLAIGEWQFVMMVEMDGPRADRTIAVQVHGMKEVD